MHKIPTLTLNLETEQRNLFPVHFFLLALILFGRYVTSWRRAKGRRLSCSFCGIPGRQCELLLESRGWRVVGALDGSSLCRWHFNPFLCFCPSNTSDSRAPAPAVRRRECHSRRCIINTWTEPTGDAAGGEKNSHAPLPTGLYQNCLRITEIITMSVLSGAALRLSWMSIREERAVQGSVSDSQWGIWPAVFQAPGWSPSRAKQPSGVTAIHSEGSPTKPKNAWIKLLVAFVFYCYKMKNKFTF